MKIHYIIILFLFPFSAFSQKKITVNYDYSGISNYGCNYARIYKTDSNKRLEFFNCKDQKIKSREYVKRFNPDKMSITKEIQGEELHFDSLENIILRTYYQAGIKTGTETEYYSDGKIKRTCTYVNNKKDQTETFYNPLGTISNVRTYKMGTLVGAETSYKTNGDIFCTGNYKEGKPWQGMIKVHYKNGYCAFEKFENYKLIGIYAFDKNDDTLSAYEYHYINNIRLIHCTKTYENGKLTFTKNYDLNYREVILNSKPNNDTINTKTDTAFKRITFLGGIDALNGLLENNLVYPEKAIEKDLSCVVKVILIIGKEGNIIDIFTEEGCDKIFNDEALRVINFTNGWWIPSLDKTSNKNVISVCRIPITFEITEDY